MSKLTPAPLARSIPMSRKELLLYALALVFVVVLVVGLVVVR